MKKSIILSTSKPRILRNGKIVITKNKNIVKKKSNFKEKINDKLSFIKTSSNEISNINVKNKNELVVASNYNHIFENRHVYVLLTKLPSPLVIDRDLFNDLNNNNNKNYTKLEDYIQSNELQIYNNLEPKIEKSKMLTATKKTKQTGMTSSSLDNKSISKTKSRNHSIINQTSDVRITRGKTIKLQTEERKQLDQIMFNKFPDSTFKMLAIQMYDINKEVKFLRTLGLICRFKCPLNCKTKKKT
ncbi:uncharacterized protein LOC112596786 [Melanaphis sacchari]|uniref:uncharacterized protein LOC112596786 n=1 Tax=Melanaphis sacchari TaxID=742174 RepID=UPI000DC14EB5|nr:uncharacterized protein LOC112596786 [Melanaphis sacchari]XP_025198369.1 uncharacterized protein LOC112596786 [Melanaphis sacchari]XP_025198370.1 uncharacterized protein LOC112596786 [Melanaphis sacchari]